MYLKILAIEEALIIEIMETQKRVSVKLKSLFLLEMTKMRKRTYVGLNLMVSFQKITTNIITAL